MNKRGRGSNSVSLLKRFIGAVFAENWKRADNYGET
jgi:hypothetical protein